jgi:hypothetical protein
MLNLGLQARNFAHPDADILRRIEELEAEIGDALRAETLCRRIDELEAENARLRLMYEPPQPPIGWINAKQKAAQMNCSLSAVYKWAKTGTLLSARVAGRIWFAP